MRQIGFSFLIVLVSAALLLAACGAPPGGLPATRTPAEPGPALTAPSLEPTAAPTSGGNPPGFLPKNTCPDAIGERNGGAHVVYQGQELQITGEDWDWIQRNCASVQMIGGEGAGSGANDLSQYFSHGACTGSGPVTLGAPPMPLDQIAWIQPMGAMIAGHVTPVDHWYIASLPTLAAGNQSGGKAVDVYAPADGFIVQVNHRTESVGVNIAGYDRWRVVVEHSCTFWSYYDELTALAPEVLQPLGEVTGQFQAFQVRIPVKQGQVVGEGDIVDLGVVNSEVTLPGFVVPEHYDREPWKIHTVDPFDYFEPSLRDALLAKDLRHAEPRGGKIDYDVDGRLVGNWFLEGTNGYAGADPYRDWVGHLVFAYDYLDPSHIALSIGVGAIPACNCASMQFGVLGNAPDPAEVSAATGLVRYTLVGYGHYLPGQDQPWDPLNRSGSGLDPVLAALDSGLEARNQDDNAQGVLLVQMLDDRRVKVEVFLGQTPDQVSGFNEAALVYER